MCTFYTHTDGPLNSGEIKVKVKAASPSICLCLSESKHVKDRQDEHFRGEELWN